MKIATTLALAVGLAALGGCAEDATENMDANLQMPADNFDTMADDAANMDVNMDANLANDINTTDGGANDAPADNAAVNTTY